ncbi:hypothetical protein ADUPG1_003598, partial [Aduncisulcus paluster]
MFYEESSEDIISEPSQCLDYSQLIQTSFSSADISEMSSTASDGYDQSSATTLLDFPLESMNVFLMFIFELAKRTVMLKKKLFCGFFETLLFGKLLSGKDSIFYNEFVHHSMSINALSSDSV